MISPKNMILPSASKEVEDATHTDTHTTIVRSEKPNPGFPLELDETVAVTMPFK
jgi:hypothetical protein